MPSKKRGKYWNPDLHLVFVLGTSPLFHAGKFDLKLGYFREARNFKEFGIYHVMGWNEGR